MGEAGRRRHAAAVGPGQGNLEWIDQQQNDEYPAAHRFVIGIGKAAVGMKAWNRHHTC
jgi:hypothetical protein